MCRSREQIVITAAVAVLCAVAVAVGVPVPISAVLGLTLVLIPGLVWAEVFLGPGSVSLERVAVAGALSLVVPVTGGLLLDLAGLPLHRASWAALFAAVTLAGGAALLARGQRSGAASPRGQSPLPVRTAVAIGAAVLIGAGAIALARGGAAAQRHPGYTQLSLVSFAGRSYLTVGNQQGGITRYRLVLYRGRLVSDRWDISLGIGQTWQTARPSGTGPLTADLYRLPDLAHPYRHVTTDVDPPAGS